jgi:hypothetical protein
MWVAPGSGKLGAGRMLLAATIRWARDSHAHELRLGVTCGNTPAMTLYTHAGFEPTGPPGTLRPGSRILAQPMAPRVVLLQSGVEPAAPVSP